MNIHIKTTLRKLHSKPVYSLITLVGFTIGIAAGLVIYLWVYNELSYDKFHMNHERIYRVLTLSKQGNEIVKSPGCYRPVPATLKQDHPQIEYATFLSYSSENSPLQSEEGGEKIEAQSLWVSNDFFSIFNGFVFIEGDAFEAIKDPSNIILSEKVARKLFRNEPALGKTVISDKYRKEIYHVGGVVQVPTNSHIDFGYIIPQSNPTVAQFSNDWSDKGHVHVYIKLREDAAVDDAFMSQITNHIGRYSNKTDKLLFQPLADIHLHSDYEPSRYDRNISSFKYVLIFSALALLIIVMASFNFSVLSAARASERSTEIGIKKVNGAKRAHLIGQFMGESLVQTFAATVLAIILIVLFLPWLAKLTEKEIQFFLSLRLFLGLLFITVSTAVMAGIYPAFFLSNLSPTSVFRGGTVSGARSRFVRILVSVQFGIAIFFIIATSILIKQLNYIRTKDLGFNHQNIVVIPTGLWYGNQGFKDELMKNPNVLGVSASVNAPVDFGWKMSLPFNKSGVSDSFITSLIWVDEDFADTYQLEIVKGQFLNMNFNEYWKEHQKANQSQKDGKEYAVSFPVVINETAEKQLGIINPIGQRIGNNVIVGVVKDFHFRPLHHPIGSVMLMNDPQNIRNMNVKINPQNRAETIKYIRDVYRKHRDEREFSYRFVDDMLAEKYQDERRLKNLTVMFSLLAIVISILGILGMALFSIDRRIKEIGIRKVNGARISEVLIMLNRDFVKWVVIAFLIATPIAYFAMHKWLENFAYKTELSWWIFVLTGLFVLLIAMLTVSWHSWRAATRNPVESLRYE